eukprot:710708-Rhodomonas_salina.4
MGHWQLFEAGAAGKGLWVGVLGGSFHIQGGDGGTPVSDGETYSKPSYLIVGPGSFPADGAEHRRSTRSSSTTS